MRRRPVISTVFPDTPKKDPIVGMAHHLVAPCPVSNSDRVYRSSREFQKLVESGIAPFEERFSTEQAVALPAIPDFGRICQSASLDANCPTCAAS